MEPCKYSIYYITNHDGKNDYNNSEKVQKYAKIILESDMKSQITPERVKDSTLGYWIRSFERKNVCWEFTLRRGYETMPLAHAAVVVSTKPKTIRISISHLESVLFERFPQLEMCIENNIVRLRDSSYTYTEAVCLCVDAFADSCHYESVTDFYLTFLRSVIFV